MKLYTPSSVPVKIAFKKIIQENSNYTPILRLARIVRTSTKQNTAANANLGFPSLPPQILRNHEGAATQQTELVLPRKPPSLLGWLVRLDAQQVGQDAALLGAELALIAAGVQHHAALIGRD